MLENFNGYETDNDEPANVVYINDTPFQLEADNGKLYISVYGDRSNKSIKIKKGTQVVTKSLHTIYLEMFLSYRWEAMAAGMTMMSSYSSIRL